MATEEPQSLTAPQKLATPLSPDEIVPDRAEPPVVNGTARPNEDDAKSRDVPTLNGKSRSVTPNEKNDSAQNQDAFTTNGNIREKSPKAEPDVALKDTEDHEMTDVNGTSSLKGDLSPVKESSADQRPEPTLKDATPTEIVVESAEDTKIVENVPEDGSVSHPPTDSMDIDMSSERLDVTSSAEHTDNTQETSAISDAPVVSTPKDSTQHSIDPSKEDVLATQAGASFSQPDVPMADTPVSPVAKVSREREEDEGDARAAKRARTEELSEHIADSLTVKTGPSPGPQLVGESEQDPIPDDLAITPFYSRQLRMVFAGIKKTKNGGNFRASVEKLWPALWDDYKGKVPNPVDISMFEGKLREDKYNTFGELKTDIRMLYDNCKLFNGPENPITLSALHVMNQLLQERIPDVVKMQEPAKVEKGKVQSTRHVEPRAATQPRRQSQPQAPARAPSPKQKADVAPPTPSSSTAQAFALPPSGIPQIRRDSTRDDGDRPKRPIHPPKSRDPDYTSKANRKKKLEPEQRFFETVLDEAKKPKYASVNWWFLDPVDPVALNIPQYFKIVKKPMDLGTMTQRNYGGEYKYVKDVEKDVRLIAHNAELFNGPDHDVTKAAKGLEDLVKQELAKKDQWMERHYPQEAPSVISASAASPEPSLHESEDESEDDEADEESSDHVRQLDARLKEEQDKLNTLLGSKKPDLTMIEVQQSVVSLLQRKLIEEKTKIPSEKKSKSKKKSSSKGKKSSGGTTTSSGGKKSSGGSTAAPKKSSSSSKKAVPKRRVVGALEKAVIAEGINELDGSLLTKAVEIIKRDTGQNENDEGEMELDIDALSPEALVKLYDLIHKAHPEIRAKVEKKPEFGSTQASDPDLKPKSSSGKAKKNKPMNKHEQERKIEQLKELKAQLQRGGSGSQEPPPAENEEPQAEESSEESDSEEE